MWTPRRGISPAVQFPRRAHHAWPAGRGCRPLLPLKQHVPAAGLVQAASKIPKFGGSIGVNLGLIRPESDVAIVAADLVSVVAFPIVASVVSSPKLAGTRTDRRVRWRSRSHSSGETPNAP